MTAAVALRRQSAPTTKRSTSARSGRPRLRVLDQAAIRRRARRRNATLTLFIVVLSAFFLVAFVHARLVESQHELDLMRGNIRDLGAEKAQIERAVDEASSPALIVERATAIGMVRAENPVFLISVDPADGPGDLPTAEPGTLGSVALGNTALGNSALGNTALGNSGLGTTALGETEDG